MKVEWIEADYKRSRGKEIPRPEQVRRTPVRGRWGTLLAQARAEDHNASSCRKASQVRLLFSLKKDRGATKNVA